MDTTERTTARESSTVYDGFISYSHAADDLLAPRLQSALQRFAKPWWKRRAVRIFRDESSLSANPHLWSSITEALDTSGWFVLLLSPDAARSEWVNQEITYWVENLDPRKILPVVTDGSFGWENGEVTGDAVPESLRGVFSEEPRWVNVRWAKGEDQLDLQDPRFADAVADIASTIRGIPKDDLASEEVRQHRRTVRTAWAAGVALLVLTVVAVGASVQSARNADEAERQAEIASEQADIAEANAEQAEANAAAEAEARSEADQNATLARARELSGAAISVLEDDPALSTRLAVHAASLLETEQQPAAVVDALWRAGMADKLVDVFEMGEPGYTQIALSPDGSVLAVSLSETEDAGRLVLLDALTLEQVWEWIPGGEAGVEMPSFAPDGDRIVVAVSHHHEDEQAWSGRIDVLDLPSRSSVAVVPYPGCPFPGDPVWSPDGSVIAVATSWVECERPESSTARWVELIDASTWESIRVDELPANRFGSHPRWSDDGELYVFGNHTTHRYTSDFTELDALEGMFGFGDVSPDGTQLATFGWPETNDLAVFDAATLDRLDLLPWDAFPRLPVGIAFTDDGRSLFVATEGAKTTLFDVGTGFPAIVLPSGSADGVLRDERTGRIYTSHTDGTVKVWSAQSSAFGLEPLADLGVASWVNGNGISAGVGASAVIHIDIPAGEAYSSFFDQSSGEFLGDPIPVDFEALPLSDGRFAVRTDQGRLESFDPRTGDRRVLWDSDEDSWFAVSVEGTEIALGVDATDDRGRPVQRGWTVLDTNGDVIGEEEHPDMFGIVGFSSSVIIYRQPGDEAYVAIDRSTGEILWTESDFDTQTGSLLTEYGMEALLGDGIAVVDTETWDVHRIPHTLDRPRGWEFSPNRDRVAVGDEDRFVILDAGTGDELQRVPVPGVSDIHWIDESTVVIGSKDGVWARLSLDVGDLLEGARTSIRSGFTQSECTLYSIDPCPTLEELRGG